MKQLTLHHPSGEFVALMALLMCMVALSIDAVLPGLGPMASDLNVSNSNDIQLVVAIVYAGMAVGQLIYGFLADAKGRKVAISLGILIFVLGSLVALFSDNLEMMLLGRFMQGLGAAGPRTITLAIIRDQYKGNEMARVLSLVMTIFIISPVIAPLIGQGILWLFGWRQIFIFLLGLASIAWLWFWLRQPETLAVEDRVPFSVKETLRNLRRMVNEHAAVYYVIALGFIFGAFIGFLNTVQPVLQGIYKMGAAFPLLFATLTISFAAASYLNSRLVMRFGTKRLALSAAVMVVLLSSVMYLITFLLQGVPPLWGLMIYLGVTLFFVGLQFGNLNAMAMEPFGHIAGTASAVIGNVSTLLAVVSGTLVGQLFDATVLPLVAGFGVLASGAALFIHRANVIHSQRPVKIVKS
ncbi:MFS transporter, DHA1 family, bicyclomycin/chloramphenicol resistance protein [Amphritea atlantica]|uniref:Bcr/CflA family efflux transporter n=1 Tax=Amphritea atlantica TaxID=355243 RepID=A0A1H9CT91_9GAMM|nr:multidrug effflux MFS transporter [Amphritea atlantica]SEQ04351.1 MFS transporter, DHA1 family, bicyclomycin/chloramphenicol resistance protein [Amphritea atlantica]